MSFLKKINKNIVLYFSIAFFMKNIIINPWHNGGCMESIFGTIALITSIIGLFPQVYKSYKTKSTKDVSMFMLINYLVCSVAWIIHGTEIGSAYVVWSNILGAGVASIAIFQKKIYERKLEEAQ